jgi:hypothetical protein
MHGVTIESAFHVRKGRKTLRDGSCPAPVAGRVPRVSRLMALALRFEELLASDEIANQADLARLAQVTRARVTQIMNPRLLVPDIQEELLFLPSVERGRVPLTVMQLQPVAGESDWKKQREMWRQVRT